MADILEQKRIIEYRRKEGLLAKILSEDFEGELFNFDVG
jgi:hypothetical protein